MSAFDLKGIFLPKVTGGLSVFRLNKIRDFYSLLFKLVQLQVVRRKALRGRNMDRGKGPRLERANHLIETSTGEIHRKDPHLLRQRGEGFEFTKSLFWGMEESGNQVRLLQPFSKTGLIMFTIPPIYKHDDHIV